MTGKRARGKRAPGPRGGQHKFSVRVSKTTQDELEGLRKKIDRKFLTETLEAVLAYAKEHEGEFLIYAAGKRAS